MAKTKYYITLSDSERALLQRIIDNNTEDELTVNRAKVLLLSDTAHTPKLSVPKIVELAGVSHQTISKIRSIYFEQGFDVALHVLQRGEYKNTMMNGVEFIDKLKSLIAEEPPEGHKKWSTRLLADVCVKRGYVEKINHATIARILVKHNITI